MPHRKLRLEAGAGGTGEEGERGKKAGGEEKYEAQILKLILFT
jgi:hypothetical protein